MELCKVTAIFDELRLDDLERALTSHGVRGFTLSKVRGRGHYFNSFNDEQLVRHVQLDIYTSHALAEDIARLMVDALHVNTDSEGLVCITPINQLFWIHDKDLANCGDFQLNE